MRHECPGLSPDRLSTYLAGVGLGKAVAVRDPNCELGWQGRMFRLDTLVSDLVEFLVHEYGTTPIVSPWNGGSGFGANDKKQTGFVERIGASTSSRLADYVGSVQRVHEVMDRGANAEPAWPKGRLVQELRNQLPDSALDWLDAAVILTEDLGAPGYPPLAGTGGNDGRLEFSSNFHQRLADVLPELGASEQTSAAWARDALQGTNTRPLVKAAMGMFDPVGAGGPNSSAWADTKSLVNPWVFVLMLEGLTAFASGAARRFGENSTRGAMPFTVQPSAGGRMPDAPGEESRGEFWAPIISGMTYRRFRQLTREARASWDGSTVKSAVQMYGATRTFGVDRSIERFNRFTFAQLNGLAYSAVLRDTVHVRQDSAAELIAQPMARARSFQRSGAGGTLARGLDAAVTAFLSEPRLDRLLEALSAQTRLESHVLRSARARDGLKRVDALPSALPLVTWLRRLEEQGDAGSGVCPVDAEVRLAVSIASATIIDAETPAPALRSLIVGADPAPGHEASGPRIPGLGVRPLVDVLADVVVWASQHQPVDRGKVGRGFLPAGWQPVRVPDVDAHRWVLGDLDEHRLETAFLAMLGLDWSGVDAVQLGASEPQTLVEPSLSALQAFTSRRVVVPGQPASPDAMLCGLDSSWPMLLRAGRTQDVVMRAHRLLSRQMLRVPVGAALSGERTYRLDRIRMPPRAARILVTGNRGPRILAALLVRGNGLPLRQIAHVEPHSEADDRHTVGGDLA